MCRWLAYSGNPIPPHPVLFEATNSLVAQSRSDRMYSGLPNADGFGLGWYDHRDEPAIYRSIQPPWGDANLENLAAEIRSPMFIAHARAATGTPVEQTNCHPFRHGRWLFAHNGFIGDHSKVRRDLVLAVDPSLFSTIQGTTDTELFFLLALTFGLADDPLAGVAKAAHFIERTGTGHGVEMPLQMTVGITDGETLWAARYASGGEVNSLYVSEDAATVRAQHPDEQRFEIFSDTSRLVVSEPLGDMPGVWTEVEPGSALTVRGAEIERTDFAPLAA